MTTLNCAISGVSFQVSGLDFLSIPATQGYYHPVFATTQDQLYKAYSMHCKGQLKPSDSYLVFLAFLQSSGQIGWSHPATLDPTSSGTAKLIENNITQLVNVIEKTALIKHPSFVQPSFSVHYDNSDLEQIPNWIAAWYDNIDDFYSDKASAKELEELQVLENKLTSCILSGNKPEKYASVIADWACRAGEFPEDKAASWKTIIRTCFNSYKMFTTPLSLIKEVETYCHCNIEAGSIHFHELCEVLEKGRTNHIDYLGGTVEVSDFTLLPSLDSIDNTGTDNSNDLASTNVNDMLDSIVARAPKTEPIESQYSSKIEFIKAKLAYRVAANRNTESSGV
jgi:hypothetical protein